MSETKFTPGPWKAQVQPGQIVGKHTFTHEVVTPETCIATLLRAPDAHLIAAAPKLYAACEACAAWHWAERESPKQTTTWEERLLLCHYSEWLTLKALAQVSGTDSPNDYVGLLQIYADASSHRPTAPEVQVIIDRIIAAYRNNLAAARGEVGR